MTSTTNSATEEEFPNTPKPKRTSMIWILFTRMKKKKEEEGRSIDAAPTTLLRLSLLKVQNMNMFCQSGWNDDTKLQVNNINRKCLSNNFEFRE
jgi:hypothetical protein